MRERGSECVIFVLLFFASTMTPRKTTKIQSVIPSVYDLSVCNLSLFGAVDGSDALPISTRSFM